MRHRFPGISTENTTRRNALVGVGYTILGLGVIGAAAGPEEENDGGSSDGGGSDERYPSAWYYDDDTGILIEDTPEAEIDQIDSMYIRGTDINENGNDYECVQLEFDILDNSGAKAGDALANTSGLEAGQSWRFEALAANADDADSYELADIIAF